MKKNKALFLDRDGVINHNYGYVHKVNDFDFIDGIFELVRKANEKNYLVIIVTNQAGIGRGYYYEKDFLNLMKWAIGVFKINGTHIDDIFFCPFHPTHGIGVYKKDSYLRKPNPGMILEASKKHDINLKKSIMIGDNISDIQAGSSAGIGLNILYTSNNLKTKEINSIRKLIDAKKYLV